MIALSRSANFARNWAKHNIFKFRKSDSICYVVFYVAIPIIVTAASLQFLSVSNKLEVVYFYASVFISSLNCFYDMTNRWEDSQKKSIINTKLFFIGGSTLFVAGYCGTEILSLLLNENPVVPYRPDFLLLAYLVVVLVAFSDFFPCFFRQMAITKFLSES